MRVYISGDYTTAGGRTEMANAKSFIEGLRPSWVVYSEWHDNPHKGDVGTNIGKFRFFAYNERRALRQADIMFVLADSLQAYQAYFIGKAAGMKLGYVMAFTSVPSILERYLVQNALCVVTNANELRDIIDGTKQYHEFNWSGNISN